MFSSNFMSWFSSKVNINKVNEKVSDKVNRIFMNTDVLPNLGLLMSGRVAVSTLAQRFSAFSVSGTAAVSYLANDDAVLAFRHVAKKTFRCRHIVLS